MSGHVRRSLFVALSIGLSCTVHASPSQSSLYDRLGGEKVVAALSNDLVEATSSHPKLKRSWDKVDLDRVKKMLAEQICALSGGPCTYSGDSMRDVHAGHDITEAEMYGMVQLLRDTMVKHGVALRERNELLAILAPMKRDVVTR